MYRTHASLKGPVYEKVCMLVKKDPDLIRPFLEDYSNIKGGFCESVIMPRTEDEAISAVLECAFAKTPLTISGAGTGVTGGRIPFGGNVLSLEKLNHISDIRRHDNGSATITVGAGVTLKDLIMEAEDNDLFYPPDPTEKASFLSGNVSTSASGARSFKYGTTRDYVTGLRVLLSDGEIIELTRGRVFAKEMSLKLTACSGKEYCLRLPGYQMPQVKNAAGFYIKNGMDAIDLFIGQEGTLGVILAATLKLIRKPKGFMDCYAFFNEPEKTLAFAYQAKKESMNPASALDAMSIEYLDIYALDLLRKRHGTIPAKAKGAVYFQQALDTKTDDNVMAAWADAITGCHGLLDETWFAQTASQRQQFADIRHDLPDMVNESLKRRGLAKVGTDIAVRYEDLPGMIEFYNTTLTQARLRYLIFGHIGQAHLHVNILPREAREHERAIEAYEVLVKRAVSLGGTPTAEHGIGKTKHRYLEMLYGKQAVMEMADLKRQLDPACILGIDNIFPRQLLQVS
jgi:D-lactate dehydrogenase (cytochrome)